MAFRFNAILNFNGAQAIQGMNRARQSFGRMRKGGAQLGAGLSRMNQGVRGLALVTAPLGLGVLSAVKEFGEFDEVLSQVQAITLSTKGDMGALSDEAKRLGRTTLFTARQALEGATFMARAGFTLEETTKALDGVLLAAQASGIDLATASDIVSNSLRQFSLPASEAGRVADTLAIVTARSNVNMIELAEGMKFAAPTATQLGFKINDVAAAIGVLGNVGIKGTLAGTALKNAFNKLAKPSSKTLKLFGGKEGLTNAVFEFVNEGGKSVRKLKPMEAVFANLAKIAAKSKTPLEEVGIVAEILGIRGTAAFSAFNKQILQTVPITEKNIEKLRLGAQLTGEKMAIELGKPIPKLVALRLEAAGAAGASRQMSAIMVDNLPKAITLFQSALSGLKIELGDTNGFFKRAVGTGADFLNVLTDAFIAIRKGPKELKKMQKAFAESDNVFAKSFDSFVEFAGGFLDGLREAKKVFKETFDSIKVQFGDFFGATDLSTKEIGKMVAKIIAFGAVAAPIFATVAAAAFAVAPILLTISGLLGSISGIFGILSVLAGPTLTVLGVLIGALLTPIGAVVGAMVGIVAVVVIFRKEIDAFGAKLSEVLGTKIRKLFLGFKKLLSGLAGLLGDTLLSKIGLNTERINNFLGIKPEQEDTKVKIVTAGAADADFTDDIKSVATSGGRQQAIAQSSSADQIADAVSKAIPRQSSSPGSAPQKNAGVMRFEAILRGKDIHLSNARQSLAVAEAQGRPALPGVKGRVSRNGQIVVGGGG